MKLTQDDFKYVQKFVDELAEDDEEEFKISKDMGIYLEKKFNTRNKRKNFVKKKAMMKHFDYQTLPILIKNLQNAVQLKDWVYWGLSELEQDYYMNLTSADKDLTKVPGPKFYAKILSKILLNDDFDKNKSRSKQERIFIMFKVFPHFGISTLYKYSIIRALQLYGLINETHIEKQINNDDGINKLIRLFLCDGDEKKLPIFTTDMETCFKEIQEYKFNDNDSTDGLKWTEFAEKFVDQLIIKEQKNVSFDQANIPNMANLENTKLSPVL